MAAKDVAVKLSEQWQDGKFKCYKRFLGGRLFYLSQDRDQSAQMVMALSVKWRELRRSGEAWSQAVVDDVLRPFNPEQRKSTAAHGATLYKGIDAYLTCYKPRVSEGRYLRHVIALNSYKAQQDDCTLTSITWEKLNATVAHFAARPKTRHGTPMAVPTIQTTVKAVYALFDWLDQSGRWDAPKRFARLFKMNYQSLRTPLEVKKDGSGPDTFTRAELSELWKQGSRRQRLYLSLALNLGETAQGLADLTKADLHQDRDTWLIDRNRRKTGVRGVYPLWPEVQQLLEAEMDTDADVPLLLKSSDGKPLVWYHATGRVDSISKTWAHLLKKCPSVRKRGHKYLRKTGASLIEALTGSDRVAEMYLSHQGNTIAKRHYLARDFSQLAAALQQMHTHLTPF